MSIVDWFRESSTQTIVLYGLGLLFLILVLYVMAGSPGLATKKVSEPESLTFWEKPDALVALRVDTSKVGAAVPFNRYAMLVEMKWLNTRVKRQTDGENPYRHILHRGSPEVANFNTYGTLIGDSTTAETETVDTATALQTIPQGLPSRMNPGIMADPYTNDMLIFFDTEKGTTIYRESIRIPDIPLDQPFRLAISVVERYVEVYLNCQLEVTKMLEGTPRDVGREWFALSGPVPLPCQVQNLRVWRDIITHTQLRAYCAGLPDFPMAESCKTR